MRTLRGGAKARLAAALVGSRSQTKQTMEETGPPADDDADIPTAGPVPRKS